MEMEGVYINLDRAVERRSAMESVLADAELCPPYPVRRFSAVDGKARSDRPDRLKPGEYGCWLSPLGVLDASIPDGAHLHVMEDDARLSKAMALLPDLVRLLDANTGGEWDLLYLDATIVELEDMCRLFAWSRSARENGAVNLCKIPGDFTVYGTHSYIVNARRKRTLRDFLARNLRAGKPLDNVLAAGIQRGRLQAYLTAPFVTSGNELTLSGQISGAGDDKFGAWLVFRYLCFVDTDDALLAALAENVAELLSSCEPREKLLGSLLAYRQARWQAGRFPPGVDLE